MLNSTVNVSDTDGDETSKGEGKKLLKCFWIYGLKKVK